jgi:type II secretory pathway component PulK
MTVFVVTLATIIVMDIGYRARYDRRSVRAFSESIQADFILKSGVNLGRLLLEAPKAQGVQEDWLGEPWALIGSAPTLPVSGLPSDFRIEIVDEDGKIDLNAILGTQGSAGSFPPAQPNPSQPQPPAPSQIWEEALVKLFQNLGFVRDQYPSGDNRTIGNIAYEAENQLAVIYDWIDSDSESRTSASGGDGIESQAPKEWFYNRPLKSISELLNVPGMTMERVRRIAPYVKTSTEPGMFSRKININTAPLETLLAIGIPENVATSLVTSRLAGPVDNEQLRNFTTGNPQLGSILKTNSSLFTIYGRVAMPNTTRWIRATVSVQPGNPRRTQVRSIQIN